MPQPNSSSQLSDLNSRTELESTDPQKRHSIPKTSLVPKSSGTPFVPFRQPSPSQAYFTPTASQDVPSPGPRPSRASSIVSTRTGVTISTLQDDSRSARSVDLILGGRVFHINRDGSKVLEQPGLPPYSSSPANHPDPPEYPNPESARPMAIKINSGSRTPTQPAVELPTDFSTIPNQALPSSTPDRERLTINTQMPTRQFPQFVSDISAIPVESSIPSQPAPQANHAPNTVSRNPSYGPGPEIISVIPKRRSVSQSNVPDPNSQDTGANGLPGLRRRNGIRPPKIFTGFPSGETRLGVPSQLSPDARMTRSAGPSYGSHSLYPHSPIPSESQRPAYPNNPNSNVSLAVPHGHPTVEEGHAETDIPPAMESENDVSIHYTRLIRSIDREHRKALHQRDRELAEMRERLNEMDQVYRQELKCRDFTVDDLRKRLETFESQMESRIEKARNEVEDIWEIRWKDRDRSLMERMRRIEIDCQKHIERSVIQRDAEWAANWRRRTTAF